MVGEEGREDSMSESPEEASCGILMLPRYGLEIGVRKFPAAADCILDCLADCNFSEGVD